MLKIDRSFLGEGTRGEAVVQAVVGLGAAFGLQVCAEGVETPEQHARVVELGCDFAQGYLLAPPGAGRRGARACWPAGGPPYQGARASCDVQGRWSRSCDDTI